MRLVVFGVDKLVGGTIARYLIDKFDLENLILCSSDGSSPEGLFQKMTVNLADVRFPDHLRNIIQEGDILINGQVDLSFTKRTTPIEYIILHYQGLLNLLAIASENRASHVLTYIPAFLSWNEMKDVTEDTVQDSEDPIHISFQRALACCDAFWQKVELGEVASYTDWFNVWEEDLIDNEVKSETKVPEGSVIEASADNKTDTKKPPVLDGQKTIGDTPKLDQKPSPIGAAKPPILTSQPSSSPPKLDSEQLSSKTEEKGGKKPILDTPSTTKKPPILDSAPSEPKPPNLGGAPSGPKPPSLGNAAQTEDTKESQEQTDELRLTVIRGGFYFGPFDYDLSFQLCKDIRLERMKLYGDGTKPISWITAGDLGNAIREAINRKFEGQLFIKSFDASIMDLVKALEGINHSKTEIEKVGGIIHSIRRWRKEQIVEETMVWDLTILLHYLHNNTYVLSDLSTKEKTGWAPRWSLAKAAKETMNWFIRYAINLQKRI